MQAAQELNRTSSAISHQLRLLESELGLTLTEREGRGISLTPAGRRYAQEIRAALSVIALAAESSADTRLHGRLTISCTPGFAAYWLCGHLHEFRAAYPLVRLKIVTPRAYDDVSDIEADVFIAFGGGDWPNHRAELLREVAFAPICSPAFIHEHGGIREPRDLLAMPLLHLVDHGDWERWFTANGLSTSATDNGIVFSDAYLVQAAAIAGQGVALGDNALSGRHLADGQLIRPIDRVIKLPEAYYLVCDPRKRSLPAVNAFCGWLKNNLLETSKPAR